MGLEGGTELDQVAEAAVRLGCVVDLRQTF